MFGEKCTEKYNDFDSILSGPYLVLTYLMNNNQNLFKLLKYIEPNINPYNQPDLTMEEKLSMICTDAYDTNASVNSNILFQTELDEAFSTNVAQLRIEIDEVVPINDYQGYMNIWFQIIVPNKADVLQGTLYTGQRRTDSIFYELNKSLNQTVIPNSTFKSWLFFNRDAKDSTGKNNRSFRSYANKNYCSRWVCFSVLV